VMGDTARHRANNARRTNNIKMDGCRSTVIVTCHRS
jgi:hypothetical protein